ncbi:MAG: pilus assembly protein TadG-related protein [Hyphomicrobiaceae bacterium]|nr:pilus assembly protein TadG-related protein [Hyphomicrobiaceae bacterium]
MATICQSLASRWNGTDPRACLARFGNEDGGAIGVFYAVTFMMLMLIVAVAIDYGRADLEYQRVQRAADAAALAASHRLGLPDQEATGAEVARQFFKANTSGNQANEAIEAVTLDSSKGEVRIKAGGTVISSLLNAVGIRNLEVRTASRVVKGDGTVEIALVLDNSGSMAGQPIADLQTAARNLAQVVFTGGAESGRVKVGIVPFSGMVNVGAGNRASGWIDEAGLSPLNGANFSGNTPRLDLYDQLGVSWRGCVEARPAPYDTTDAAVTAANPQSLFVPSFAPDEPDSGNTGGASYQNSYLVDDGGACTPQPTTCLKYSRRGNCTNWYKEPLPPSEAQARLCKYQGATIAAGEDGPNYMCDTQPILPLSSSKTEVDSTLNMLEAKGSTNIPEGVAWGWRVLSPEAPFTEGRAYDTPANEKIMIVMTDGANTYSSYSNHNKSWYAAHGYGASGRLGTTYSSSAYVTRMNEKTLTACANAKAAGVKIYTVAFRLESDPTTLSLLQSCASEASMAYRAGNGASLIAAFERIGTEISKLRIAG